MHSRIFQVGTTEIAPSDYIQPADVSDRLYATTGSPTMSPMWKTGAEELKYLMEVF